MSQVANAHYVMQCTYGFVSSLFLQIRKIYGFIYNDRYNIEGKKTSQFILKLDEW